jgi:hypothetical protein
MDTDDELEDDEATQATQAIQDHEAQPITTTTSTTSKRPKRQASITVAKTTRARTLSTGSVEMPPSTNPDNKKGKGKARAKGPK